MFANPLYSVAILLALACCYLIIRIKHGAPLLANNADIQGFWQRWWARFVAFRSWAVAAIVGLGISLPDILVAIAPLDFSWLIGPGFAPKLTGILTLFLALNTFTKTKPDGVKAV